MKEWQESFLASLAPCPHGSIPEAKNGLSNFGEIACKKYKI